MSECKISICFLILYLYILYFTEICAGIDFGNFDIGALIKGGAGGGGGGGGCPNGTDWHSLSMIGIPGCIYVDQTKSVTWGQGQKLCKQQDARSDLAYFADTKQMNSFQRMSGIISTQVGKVTVWLGGYLNRTDNKWHFMDSSEMMTNTTGGWQPDTPNKTATSPQRCLGYAIGGSDVGWRDLPCTMKISFGCYIANTNLTLNASNNVQPNATGLSSPAKGCPTTNNWVPAGGYCYAVSSTMAASYDVADSYCKTLDSRATLPQFYYQSDYDNFTLFIGNLVDAEHQRMYLAPRKTSGKFRNPDGTFAFTNWYYGQPLTGDCVMTVDVLGFGWNASDCSTQAYVVCQLNTSIAGAPPPTTTTTTIATTTTTKTTTKATTTTTIFPTTTTTATTPKAVTNYTLATVSTNTTLTAANNSTLLLSEKSSLKPGTEPSVSAQSSSATNSSTASSNIANNVSQTATQTALSETSSYFTYSTVSSITSSSLSVDLLSITEASTVATPAITITESISDSESPNIDSVSTTTTTTTAATVIKQKPNVNPEPVDYVEPDVSNKKPPPSVLTLQPSYSMGWSAPLWFLIVLALLVILPIIFWITAIVYREVRNRKYRNPPNPQYATFNTAQTPPNQTEYILT